ncbi:MAG: hypothetical protein LUF30_05265 [Lachnospiraceae bacterium]|nr:hypothetical protein [Lachnospiraceae bacterium]
MMRKISRRDFLRGSAAFFAGSVVLGSISRSTLSTKAEEASGENVSEVLAIWQNPSDNVDAKPMTRFWFPDAGAGLTDEDYETYKEELATGDGANLYSSDYLQSVAEIETELYDAGFGGVEVTMLCDSASYSSTQARIVGWGTPAWCRVLTQALYTANHLGDGAFKVDLTLTSHWPLIIDNIDPNDPQQQKGLVLGSASPVDIASLEAAGSTRLSLPEQDIQDGGGATFLFEDDLVAVTLVKKTDELYDLASAISLNADETGGYAVGVPKSELLIQYDGRWYDQEWFSENFADVDQSGLETSEVTKNDTFNIAYGLENGRNRDYLDDWQYYYEVKNQDILDAVGDDTEGDW